MSPQQPPSAPKPTFYTAPETAVMFRMDDSTIYRHLRKGTFPGIKVGGRYIVPDAAIERLIADVLATGRCIDLVNWTQHWRNEQAAVIARLAAADVWLPGDAA